MADDEKQPQNYQIPVTITDSYLKEALQKAEDHIKDLRSQENYDSANQFLWLITILENVHFQLKNEEKKSQELYDRHIDATGRIEDAMRISQKDNELIRKLEIEAKNAWNETDAAKLREQHTSESLMVTREKYTALIQKTSKFSSKTEVTDELGEHKVTVLQQCEKLNVEVDELTKRLTVQRLYSDELQKKLDDALERNRDLFREWDTATNESLSNKKRVEKLQKSLDELTEEYERVTESLQHFKELGDFRHKRLTEREKQVLSLSEKVEKLKSENSVLNVVKSKLELAMKSYENEFADIQHQMDRFKSFVKQKDEENRKLISEREQESKKAESLVRKLSSIEKTVNKQELEISFKVNEIVTAEKERDLMKKSSDDMKRENDKLIKKIEQLMREIEKLSALNSALKQERQKLEEDQMLLNNDLKSSIEREKRSSGNVKKLQANIETVESEKMYLNETIKQLNEEIEMKKKQFEKIKTELIESNEQAGYFKHEYNTSIKRLKESRAEFQRCHEKESDVKDRLIKLKSQIDDVNDKLSIKLTEIVSLMQKIKRLEKKGREMKRDYERSQDTLRLCRKQLKHLDHENKLMKGELRENHSRIVKMKNQADKILRERDSIANQMYRKVDENSLLEEQVSMLKMTIERGNSMYSQRMEDIRIMKNEVRGLRSQCNVLKRGLQNTTDMRHEVLQLHRKLNQERTKCKVLEEEMVTPMNVHRWRKLSYRDPGRMELIRKCQRLQRNCLKEWTRNVKAEELISVLQQRINKFEIELQKRPGVEISEKLMIARSKLQASTKRMKAAIALSRATESDINLKDNAINQLQIELNTVKSQLFKEKQMKHKLAQKMKEKVKNCENYFNQKEKIEKLKTLGNDFKRKFLV